MLAVLALLRAAAALPWPWQVAIGGVLGRLLHALAGGRRRAARTNLALCFPHMPQAEREALLRASFRDFGIGLFEFARAWWGDASPWREGLAIEGLDGLRALQAQGRGVLLVSGHFLTLESSGRLLCDHVPVAGMYRRCLLYTSPSPRD